MAFLNPFDAEVDRRIAAAYVAEGYADPGEEDARRDTKAMKEAAFGAFAGKVAVSKLDKADSAVTPGELYAAVFPHGPGAAGDAEMLEGEDRAAYEKLKREVWGLTQAKPDGWIQRRLADEGSTLVLCRAKVMRGQDPVMAAYLTDEPTLIMEDSLNGEVEGLVRRADNLRKHVDMLLQRHPELEARVLKELGRGIRRAAAALPAEGQDLEEEAA